MRWPGDHSALPLRRAVLPEPLPEGAAEAARLVLGRSSTMPGRWRLLEFRPSLFGAIRIFESLSDGSRLYLEDGAFQSHARPDGHSRFTYIAAIRAILLAAGTQRLAVLGGAGGTLATLMARSGVGDIEIVEVNPDAEDIARRYFWLSPQVRWTLQDAAEWAEEQDGGRLDAIVLDAFDNYGTPPHLSTPAFFHRLATLLAPGGTLIVNAVVPHQTDPLAEEIGERIAATGLRTQLLDGGEPGERNVLVVGGDLPTIRLPRGDEPSELWPELRGLRWRRQAKGICGEG